MPFIPHTPEDIAAMLKTIGVASINDLFDEIPENLKTANLNSVPSGMTEMEVGRLCKERAKQDEGNLCFIGAGAYEHHIPAAVWDVVRRGEFMTAYTPYQAEASQGTLQLLYEFQTMMASLMGLDVSNASLYDGASALAEAVLMAVRANRKTKSTRILLPRTIHPHYADVVKSIVGQQDIEIVDVPYDAKTGRISFSDLQNYSDSCALVIPQPNFFGVLENVDELTDWAASHNILTIAVVNPLATALLKAPGQWGKKGVDIACGEGQSLGVPLASGGPYYGFLCCKKDLVRQLPGRIVGRTVDSEGKQGFVLTLQAREQHIRRAKANSNICTNQGLLVTASTIYMSLMGPEGLRDIALVSHANSQLLQEKLIAIPGVKKVFSSPTFHETVMQLSQPVDDVLKELTKYKIQGGLSLREYYPELGNALLICATETKSAEDIDKFIKALNTVMLNTKKENGFYGMATA